MPEWIASTGRFAFWFIFAIGCQTALSSVVLYFRDRTGNSGRQTHWEANPRIKGPDE